MSYNPKTGEVEITVDCGGSHCFDDDPHSYENRHEHQSDSGQADHIRAGKKKTKQENKGAIIQASGTLSLKAAPLSSNKKPTLENLPTSKDFNRALHDLSKIMAIATGRANFGGLLSNRRIAKELIEKGGVPEVNGYLANQKEVPFNMDLVATEISITLNQIENKMKENKERIEDYKTLNTILDAYKKVYEKSIDPILAKEYQTLARNFRYSSARQAQAQRRYQEFMQNRRFRLSHEDRKILNDLENLKKVSELHKTTKNLSRVSRVFGWGGKIIDIAELSVEFNKAQQTGNWTDFNAKVGEMAAGMLVSAIVGLALPISLPSAFVAAVLGAVASYYLDQEFWKNMQLKMQTYFE